ncbi:hypothetical protein [Levilactobacillus fuyuanensis]|uniref:Uncharacterized protein n=1 Tax=Levilactobacillus fuyuanensis TaxID=2486022 RepID=A0ABW4H6E3_9LACO|nr:hypothetical protein [Levilactobacillus fuyuanensis]
MLKQPRRGDHNGWLLPDALLALGIVALTIGLARQTLTVTQYGERVRTTQLQQARDRRDRALLDWAANQ